MGRQDAAQTNRVCAAFFSLLRVCRNKSQTKSNSQKTFRNFGNKKTKRYGISLDVLLFGEEPRMSRYYLTRNGQGPEIDRGDKYQYQTLAGGFRGRKMDPFLVVVDPLPAGKRYSKNTHDGQEVDYILEGTLELTIDDKVLVLKKGDCIYFDATIPHCMNALNGKPAKFLCVVN